MRPAFGISARNRSLFVEARGELESRYQGILNEIKKEDKAYIKKYGLYERLEQFNLIRRILMEYETADREEEGKAYEDKYVWSALRDLPKRQTIAATRCDMGIVADKKLYRSVPGEKVFKIWNYVPDKSAATYLYEQAMKAIEEGFPATALKIGKDLWAYTTYNSLTYEILYAAYGALNRPILQKVLQKIRMPKNLLEDADFKLALQSPEQQIRLQLVSKKARTLPKEIGQFKNLERLNISANELEDLPNELEQLSQLTFLNLNHNSFHFLPEVVCKLGQLKILKLSSNRISTLPDAFTQLQNLEELYLSYLPFTTFPKAICSLKKLKKLIIYSNQITALPDELNQLEQLEELNIYSTKAIRSFPKSLVNLKQLKILKYRSVYDSKPLPAFPKSFCDIVNLESLEVSRFFDYPDELNHLKKLTYLKLENYELTTLPSTIFKLKALKKLSVSCCRIEELPDEISELTELENIYLYGNCIQKVPDTIVDLPNLQQLNLGSNQLSPQEIERIKKRLPHVKLEYSHQKLP